MGDPRQDGLYNEVPTDANDEYVATIITKPQDGFGSKYGCAAHFLFLQIRAESPLPIPTVFLLVFPGTALPWEI